jgi:hypothetical protein
MRDELSSERRSIELCGEQYSGLWRDKFDFDDELQFWVARECDDARVRCRRLQSIELCGELSSEQRPVELRGEQRLCMCCDEFKLDNKLQPEFACKFINARV